MSDLAPDPPLKSRITGLILAGGRARRLGGGEKALRPFRGRPLIEHVLERLTPQAGPILINANRNPEAFSVWGHPLTPDALADNPGPLAGIAAGLAAARTEFVLTVPCDAPFLPVDLAVVLHRALMREAAPLAVARDATGMQPTFCLLRPALLPDLNAFLAKGGRKARVWQEQAGCAMAAFSGDPRAFVNLNTPQEWAAQEAP